MTMTPAKFRQDFPEFACTTTYPDTQVNLYVGLAGKLLNADRWDDMLDMGTSLFVAHHLVIGQRNVASAEVGGAPGAIQGPQSSKSVDKVSVSYDTGAVTLADGGFWNMSSYGIRLLQIARYVGAGGVQL
jgi:Protein of unknown function (DUF4054)